jgi:hypothetical protein
MTTIVSRLRGERVLVEPQVEEFTIEIAGLRLRIARVERDGEPQIAVDVFRGDNAAADGPTLYVPAPADACRDPEALAYYRGLATRLA